MKHLPLLSLAFVFLLIASCMDDDDVVRPVNVPTTVEFRATYDDADLAIGAGTYDYPTGAKLKANLFQYYVSDLVLLADDGNTVGLSDIELIRYGSEGDGSTDTRTYEIPNGNYTGLRFGLGVKPELNAQDPRNFAANAPLNENEFWNANARYVFAKIEANADLENDGTFDTGLTYHMGSDALYTTITFEGNFAIEPGNAPKLVITADMLKALSDGTNTFDISNPDQQRVHGGNQAIATDIWNRLAGQFSLTVEQ